MTTPSFIPPIVSAIVPKKESDVADQLIKTSTNFLEQR